MTHRRLVVASDQPLVAEAVRIAMSSHGFDTVVAPWGRPVAVGEDPRGPLLGLIISDLESLTQLHAGQEVVRGSVGRWLVLTSTPRGPTWGALLESGVTVILPSATTLEETVGVLDRLAEGEDVEDVEARPGLVQGWQEQREERERLVRRVESLTPRERTVLAMLSRGEKVVTIADSLEISEATVRSHVRAVLRKLGVNSQLAAVALDGWLRSEQAQLPAT